MEKATICPLDYVNAEAAKARVYVIMPAEMKQNAIDPVVQKARGDYEAFCSSYFKIQDQYKENTVLEENITYSDFGRLVISYGRYILKNHPELTLEWVQEVCSYTKELLTKWDPEQHTPFLYILKQECQPRGMIGHAFMKNHLDYKWVWIDKTTEDTHPCTVETREMAKTNGWTQVIQEYSQLSIYKQVNGDKEIRHLDLIPSKESDPYAETEINLSKADIMKITRLSPFDIDLIELIHTELGNKISPQTLPYINILCQKYNMPALSLSEAKMLKKQICLTIRFHRVNVRKCICGKQTPKVC